LPAVELESKVAHVIAKQLTAPSFIGPLFPDATAAEIADAEAKIDAIGDRSTSWLELIKRIDLNAGELNICLDQKRIATLFERDSNEQLQDLLTIKAPSRSVNAEWKPN